MTAEYRRLAHLVDSAPDAIITLTCAGQVESWNASAARMYGYSSDESVGRSMFAIVPAELHIAVARHIASAAAGEHVPAGVAERLRKDRVRIVVASTLFPVTDDTGTIICIAVVEHEVALTPPFDDGQRPHGSDAAIGINAGVAQEFNNINTSILGFVDLIRYEVRGRAPLEHDLDEIARQTLRASRLAGQLLASQAAPASAGNANGADGALCPEYAVADLPGAETILVVDDEAPVRSVVCRGLRRRGYRVLEATNGEDALIVADRYAAPIHLVVSDVVMPKMDGRVLFEHLRNWYPNTSCLFISGYAQGVTTPSDLAGTRTRFLAKPFSLDDLCREVRVILNSAAGHTG